MDILELQRRFVAEVDNSTPVETWLTLEDNCGNNVIIDMGEQKIVMSAVGLSEAGVIDMIRSELRLVNSDDAVVSSSLRGNEGYIGRVYYCKNTLKQGNL